MGEGEFSLDCYLSQYNLKNAKLSLCIRLKTFRNTYLSSQVKTEVTDSEDSDKEFEWSQSSLPGIYLGVFLILSCYLKYRHAN